MTGPQKGLLYAEDGAVFSGHIEKVEGDHPFRASYLVEQHLGDRVLTQNGLRMFTTREEAKSWITGEAMIRRFREQDITWEND